MGQGLTVSGLRANARVFASVALLAALALGACSRSDPEQALRAQLAQMQADLEAGDARAFMGAVAEDFVGTGGIDRAALQQGVRAQVLAHRRIGITTGPVDVRLHGEQASTEFSVITTGGAGGLLPDSARTWQVSAGWRQEQGQWRLYHLDWKPR
jgi:hypothetical protein